MSILHIKNIHAKAADGTAVVRGVSLSVKPGEVHIIMGKNGSGKSSLVNSVMGHPRYKIEKGNVKLGSKDVLALSPEEKARAGLFLSMQYLPEIDGVTLAYFLHQIHKSLTGESLQLMEFYARAIEEAKRIGVGEEFLKRPIHKGLSGGEKKQTEVLQLLMAKPKFAFLDEVDSGVDVGAMKNVVKGLKQLNKEGTALILITHYPHIAKSIKPDKVHIMSAGKILESGGPEIAKKIEKSGF